MSLAEASALAALSQAPDKNPPVNTQSLEEARNRILQDMLIQGWITSDELIRAGQEKLNFQPLMEPKNSSPAFTNLVLDQLSTQIPYAQLVRGGYRIITTLDYDLQMQSICAVERVLKSSSEQPEEPVAPDGSPCQVARLISSVDEEEIPPANSKADLIVLDPSTGQILSLVGEVESNSTISSFVIFDKI